MTSQAIEPRTRSYSWTAPEVLVRGADGLSGLAFLRKVVEGNLPQAPLSDVLQFRLVEVSEGFARFVGSPGEQHYNPMGSVHGGWASALLDSAMGCAVLSTLDETRLFTTVQLSVNLLRPMSSQTGEVRCEARFLQSGKTVSHVEARMTDSDGKPVAAATASWHPLTED